MNRSVWITKTFSKMASATMINWEFGITERLLIWVQKNTARRKLIIFFTCMYTLIFFLDIYGNVREWCLDGYGARPSGKLVDPMLGWENMDKVNRGGSWDSCEACCETAKRMNYGENYQSRDIGYRLTLGYPFPQMIKKWKLLANIKTCLLPLWLL